MNIVTGVIQANNVSSEAVSDEFMGNGIDLGYEEYIAEHGEDNTDDYMDNGDNTYLVGFVKDDEGKYDIDPNAEVSAIFGTNHNTIQVVHSKWIVEDARWCSPCYPNQADLDSKDGGVIAYTLPPDWFDEYTKPVNQPEYIGEKETLERKD